MELWFESYRFLEERPLREDERRELADLESQVTLNVSLLVLWLALALAGAISIAVSLEATAPTVAWTILSAWIALVLRNRAHAALTAARDLRNAQVKIYERVPDVAQTDLRSDLGEDTDLDANQAFEIFEGASIVEALTPSGRIVHMEGHQTFDGYVSAVQVAAVYPVEQPESETRDLTPEEIEELNHRIDTENGVAWPWIALWFAFFFSGAVLLANHRFFPGFWLVWPISFAALWYSTSTRNTASRYRRTMGLALEYGTVEVRAHEHGWQERMPVSDWPWTLNGWPARWRRS